MCTGVRRSSNWYSDFYKWSLCRRGYDFEDDGYYGNVFVKQGAANNLYATLLLTSIKWILNYFSFHTFIFRNNIHISFH